MTQGVSGGAVWGFGGAAVAAVLIAGAWPAQAEMPTSRDQLILECKMEKVRADWIPEQIYLFKMKSGDGILVYDPIIHHFVEKPIEAKVMAETKVRTTYGWSVDARDDSRQYTRMVYRLSYFRDGRPAQITAAPGGYDNSFSGKGTCKPG